MALHPVVAQITERIRARSAATRAAYLAGVSLARRALETRSAKGNAHRIHAAADATGPAANGDRAVQDPELAASAGKPLIAVVCAELHGFAAGQPGARYAASLQDAARAAGVDTQLFGCGVPASLVEHGSEAQEDAATERPVNDGARDRIAMAAAAALSNGAFDALLCLGSGDEAIAGLLTGALRFGHLPAMFVAADAASPDACDDAKAQTRRLYADGKIDRDTLLESESRAGAGTGCAYAGNESPRHDNATDDAPPRGSAADGAPQHGASCAGCATHEPAARTPWHRILLEALGLQLPGAAFVAPGTRLGDALTRAAMGRASEILHAGSHYTPVAQVIDERAIVNGIVCLLATGISASGTPNLAAIARAAGILVDSSDIEALGRAVPLLTPLHEGGADMHRLHAAGGMGLVIRELLEAGFLHEEVRTVASGSLSRYTREPELAGNLLIWRGAPARSRDENVLRHVASPFGEGTAGHGPSSRAAGTPASGASLGANYR